MLNVAFIAGLSAFWIALHLLRLILKQNTLGNRILRKLSAIGFSIGTVQFRFYTSRFNRKLHSLVGIFRPIIWRRWFAIGSVITCLCTIFSVSALVFLIYSYIVTNFIKPDVSNNASGSSTEESSRSNNVPLVIYSPSMNDPVNDRKATLVPLVPGINLPLSQVVYVLVALLVCGIFHELGHAIAAVVEHVRLNGCGMFVFILYPGAYVDLSTENLQDSEPHRQLRIYCAGVWHNLVMCVGAAGLLFSIPYLWPLVYNINTGVAVIDVKPGPLSGNPGLVIGDHITALSNCPVKNATELKNCVFNALNLPQPGQCMKLATIRSFNTSVGVHKSNDPNVPIDCCTDSVSRSSACFYHLRANSEAEALTNRHIFSCLPAHTVVTGNAPFCSSSDDCRHNRRLRRAALPLEPDNPTDIESPPTRDEEIVGDDDEMHCVFPVVSNATRLIPVFRKNSSPLLFFGYPFDLLLFTSVTDFVPVHWIISARIPAIIDRALRYFLSISAALVLLNSVPCYGLDGQFILGAILDQICPFPKRQGLRKIAYRAGTGFGTLIILVNVILAFTNLA